MATKQIRVSEDLYARVESENRDDETLGETLERLVDTYTLVDFADDMADLTDDHPDPEELERAIEDSDERTRAELDEQLP